jgi:hypothetical protein
VVGGLSVTAVFRYNLALERLSTLALGHEESVALIATQADAMK